MKLLLSIVLTLLLAISISGAERAQLTPEKEVAIAEQKLKEIIKKLGNRRNIRICGENETPCTDLKDLVRRVDANSENKDDQPAQSRSFLPVDEALPYYPPPIIKFPTFPPFRPLTWRPQITFRPPGVGRPRPFTFPTRQPRPQPTPQPPFSTRLNILSPEEEAGYCSLSCRQEHIICPENGLTPGAECPANPPYNDMEDLKDLIVDFHNELRDQVAAGRVEGLPTASRMGTMEWDHELHLTATYQTNLCITQQDICFGTQKYTQPGLNVGAMSYGGRENRLSLEYIVKDMLKLWSRRSAHVTREIIHSFPLPDWNGTIPDYGLFTVMAQEGNTRVGCGINRFEVLPRKHKVMFTCHYAKNNFIGISTYKAGPPTSECITGTNPQYRNLCSAREKYHLSDLSIEL